MSQVLDGYKVKVQNGKSCEKLLTIEVSKERIASEYKSFYEAIAPKAKIPGFRPGKAPQNILEMHFQKDADGSVLEQLVNDSLFSSLKANELHPILNPVVEDIQFNKEKLTFKAKVEIRPEIKLSKVTGLSAKKSKVEVPAKEVEATLKRIQESQAQYKTVDTRSAQEGDFVVVDYVCEVEGKEIEKKEADWVEIKKDEFLKGFSTQLIGVKANEEKNVEVTFPKDTSRKEIAAKKAIFKMKVKEIKERKLPELNDEFAKQAGDFENLSALKTKIEKDLLVQKERESNQELEKNLLDQLVKNNKFEPPKGLVDRRIEELLEQGQKRMQEMGQKVPELDAKEKEKARRDIEPEAKKQIQLAFILDEIAKTHKLQAEEADLDKKFAEYSELYRQPAEAVSQYYRGNAEALEHLREVVRQEKTVAWVKSQADIKS